MLMQTTVSPFYSTDLSRTRRNKQGHEHAADVAADISLFVRRRDLSVGTLNEVLMWELGRATAHGNRG